MLIDKETPLHQNGLNSRSITVPLQWIKLIGDNPGKVLLIGNRILILAPLELEKEARRMLAAGEKAVGESVVGEASISLLDIRQMRSSRKESARVGTFDEWVKKTQDQLQRVQQTIVG